MLDCMSDHKNDSAGYDMGPVLFCIFLFLSTCCSPAKGSQILGAFL